MDNKTAVDISILSNLTLLYVEDDDVLRSQMEELMAGIFREVITAANGNLGLEAFIHHHPHLVLTDIRMPQMGGLELARALKERSPATPVIITTAFSDASHLMDAIEIGVDGYVQKPIRRDELLAALYKCALPLIQQHRIETLSHSLQRTLQLHLGVSPVMEQLVKRICRVAASDFSVVLQGETGSGKSMAAGIIHELSHRADGPFVTVDVGSIPEALIESELFGHKKGAFTGAHKDHKGFLEAAEGGTIFFDEMENLPLQLQAKLLRAVDERKIFPLGSTEAVKLDVRILCAVNVDLKELIAAKKFREDLYYRLMEFDLEIPLLRERPEDIVLLARRFTGEADGELKKKSIELTPAALTAL